MASTSEARALERELAATAPPQSAPARRQRLRERLRPALLPALSIAALILAWEFAALYADAPRRLPSPTAVLAAIGQLAASGELFYELGVTLARVAASFVLAMAIGTALGIAMGRSPGLDRFGHPWLVFFLNIPALVTIVLAYIWIGLTETALIVAVAANKIPNVVVTLREGSRALDRNLLEMAACFESAAGGRSAAWSCRSSIPTSRPPPARASP